MGIGVLGFADVIRALTTQPALRDPQGGIPHGPLTIIVLTLLNDGVRRAPDAVVLRLRIWNYWSLSSWARSRGGVGGARIPCGFCSPAARRLRRLFAVQAQVLSDLLSPNPDQFAGPSTARRARRPGAGDRRVGRRAGARTAGLRRASADPDLRHPARPAPPMPVRFAQPQAQGGEGRARRTEAEGTVAPDPFST